MTKYDWVAAVGMALTSATALWYQVRYYRLVDDLISALSQDSKEEQQ